MAYLLIASALLAQQDESVKKLIRDLSSDEFDVRERASDRLVAVGKKAVPSLRDAVEASRDPEVKVRAAAVLDRILTVRATVSLYPRTRKLKIRLVNDMDRPVVLGRARYCHRGPFYPRVTVEIVSPNGDRLKMKRCPRDTTNLIEPESLILDEISEVPPGETLMPMNQRAVCFRCSAPDAFRLPGPGTYQVRFIYDARIPEPGEKKIYVDDPDHPRENKQVENLHMELIDSGWVAVTVR